MKIQFNPDLDYQAEAISSIVDIFEGQELCQTNFTVAPLTTEEQKMLAFDENDLGVGNRLRLLDEEDAAIKKLIDDGLKNTTVTVVFVGEKTAGRKYINYEIEQSIGRGNGIVAVQIHHLEDQDGNTDSPGAIPAKIEANGYKAYKYVGYERLAKWIEEAANAAGK